MSSLVRHGLMFCGTICKYSATPPLVSCPGANIACLLSSNSSFYQVMFYLPIYFQSIHGKTAIMSGVDTLPFLAVFSLGAVMSGGLIGKTHHLMPFQLNSALIMVAGMALFYTMRVDTSQACYLGPQVLYGFGLGLGNQIPMAAVQGASKPEDVASSTGIILSMNTSCLSS